MTTLPRREMRLLAAQYSAQVLQFVEAARASTELADWSLQQIEAEVFARMRTAMAATFTSDVVERMIGEVAVAYHKERDAKGLQ